jgi:hypothetical protein
MHLSPLRETPMVQVFEAPAYGVVHGSTSNRRGEVAAKNDLASIGLRVYS